MLVKKIVHNLRYLIRVCTPLFKILATGLLWVDFLIRVLNLDQLVLCKKFFGRVVNALFKSFLNHIHSLYFINFYGNLWSIYVGCFLIMVLGLSPKNLSHLSIIVSHWLQNVTLSHFFWLSGIFLFLAVSFNLFESKQIVYNDPNTWVLRPWTVDAYWHLLNSFKHHNRGCPTHSLLVKQTSFILEDRRLWGTQSWSWRFRTRPVRQESPRFQIFLLGS